MFEINEKVIKQYANDITYRRGLLYYRGNKVVSMDVEKSNREGTVLYAGVESSGDWEYDVNIEYDKDGFTNFDCSCEAFREYYNGGGICKHIVAVLLKHSKEYKKSEEKMKTIKMDHFIEQLKRGFVQPNEIKKELNLEIKYEFEMLGERVSSIELKVGENKNYVVKNMKSFLEKAKHKNSQLEFGKGFTFDPRVHCFKEEDMEIINLLIEVYEMDSKFSNSSAVYGRYYSGNGPRFLSGKKAYLTTTQLKRFFKLIENRKMDITIYGKLYSESKVVQQDLPLTFNLLLEKENVILNLKENMPIPLTEDGEYFFYDDKIYNPSSEQRRLYAPFYNEFVNSKDRNMVFSKEDSEKIASYIVPNLKRISKNINIDTKLERNFYEEPLKITIYLDKEGDAVTAELIFIYGGLKINALNENGHRQDGRMLIRDIDKEMSATALLQNLGFVKEKNKLTLRMEGKIVELLSSGIATLQDIGEVYYSEGFKGLKVYNSSSLKSKIKLNDNDLLEFSFDLEGVDKTELKNIFKALKEKKKYYKLKKGGFVSLEEKELKNVSSLIEYLDIKDSDLEKDKILLAKYNALYIDQSLKENSMIYVQRNKKFRELVNNIKEVQEMDFSVPKSLEEIMRSYQKFGYKWLKTLSSCGFGGILADEMGLGKTLQAISFIQSEKEEQQENKKPTLVVAPTSLVYNWKSEIEKFAPGLKTLVVSGSKNEREELRKEMEEQDVIITSYPLIRRDIEEYKKVEFAYCFLDEAQQIKNPLSINSQSVKEIKAKGYFALTGTPIENSLTELWSIFDFIMPGYMMTQGKFSKKYEAPIVRDKDQVALEELNRHIKPFILRRLKKDVSKELPPKIEHKIIVEMTEEQKKIYMAYLTSVKEEIDEEIKERGFNRSKIKILAALTRLRQICCEPSVFMENFQGESGKMLALDDLLEESINEGHRILLFSQFTSVLKNIVPRLEKNNIEYMYLDGSTKSELRGEMVKEFNEGKGSVFLISLKAGGTGLNLTGADVVIHFDPWWNPAVEDQASDRAHRIGQKKTVEVIKLIARGTIEEKIYLLQEKKKEMIKAVMDEEKNGEFLISQMDQRELEDLFK